MAKEKTVYVCTNCGQESPKWAGKCPSCGQWNTFVEEVVRKEMPVAKHVAHGIESVRSKPQRLHEITSGEEQRIDMGDDELNRVLGGGLVEGSLTLIGGEPGIGKSTLVLQTVLRLTDKKVLYISGEESARQLKLRADRIPHPEANNLLIACETSLEQIFTNIKNTAPDLVIIDSIQTISTENIDSSPGSIVQVRECSASILKFAKETGTPVILIGHINKEGSIAGPKVLEHIVDTVLQFEGDQHYMYRILRSIKNRFGSTAELGIYEMRQDGLRHRGTGAGEYGSVRHASALGYGIRPATHEHAAGGTGEACRIQTGAEGCLSEHRRRAEGERSGHRPGGNQCHSVEQHGYGNRSRCMHGGRSGTERRNPSRKPYRAAHQ